MVKNRSWETRHEIADARRMANKQRKQRREDSTSRKAMYKSMVSDLMSMMDQNVDQFKKRAASAILHVWTDTPHSDGPSLEEIINSCQQIDGSSSEDRKRQRRRSSSFNETPKKGGGNNIGSSGKKKKGRSNSMELQHQDSGVALPQLCNNYFFKGKCPRLQRKNASCCHLHYTSDRYKTLANIVKKESNLSESQQAVAASSVSLGVSDTSTEDSKDNSREGGMEMVYYCTVPLFPSHSEDDETTSVSEALSNALSTKSCSLGSIVYLAVDNVFVFDRYRDGLLMSDNGFATTVLGDTTRRRRSSSVESQGETRNFELSSSSHDGTDHPALWLPGPLLENIATFLPDVAVGTMSLTCKAWNAEIGTASPALWQHLLQRRKWPLPPPHKLQQHSTDSPRDVYRDEFVMHFSVVRDMYAIQAASAALSSSGKGAAVKENKEMVYQSFSSRRGAPQPPNNCVGVRVWSPNRMLAAYVYDCTLRLFEAVSKPTSDASGGSSCTKSCREVVCVRVAPVKNTKRKSCRLLAMDVDEQMVGCLCATITAEKDTFFLAVVSREDFLCASGGEMMDLEDGTLHVIDIGEAVLNFLRSLDAVDHNLLRLLDFIHDVSDVSKVEVRVSSSVAACGYGRFMVEVCINIPPDVLYDDDMGDEPMSLVDRKLVLFSASVGAIVWMGNSNPTQGYQPRSVDMNFACLRTPQQALDGISGLTDCSVAIVSSSCPVILSLDIDPTGYVSFRRPYWDDPDGQINKLLLDGWELHSSSQRPVVITTTDIVVADTLGRTGGDRKTIVSFYPTLGVSPFVLTLDDVNGAVRMSLLGDQHVVLFCAVLNPRHTSNLADLYDYDCGIVIHVPSRQEVERVRLSGYSECETFLASCGDTIGCGISWYGIVLTGDHVRSIGKESIKPIDNGGSASKKKKKKKKRHASWGNKKDAYVRGQSMSG